MTRWLSIRFHRLWCRLSRKRREKVERIHRVEQAQLARGSRNQGGPLLADATGLELRAAATFNRRRARQLSRANQRPKRRRHTGYNLELAEWLDKAADLAGPMTLDSLPRREYEDLCLEAHDLVFREAADA